MIAKTDAEHDLAEESFSNYLNDTWTHQVEHLGYELLRDELVTMTHLVEPPFAAAVYGGWGSGKTSLMRSVMVTLGGNLDQLPAEEAMLTNNYEVGQALQESWEEASEKNPEHHLPCVWFNPWQHQNEAHPMVALLHEIRRQFSFRLKVMDETVKLAQVAMKTGLRLLDDLTATVSKALTGHAASLNIGKIEATGKAYEKEHYAQPLDSQRFQMHFEAAIAHLVGGETPNEEERLVIFIDDLDRCESDALFKLLESIKLYLSTRKCVFFLGLDPNHTEAALRQKNLKDQHQARNYLQKLFQLSVHLPRAHNFAAFIDSHLVTMKAPDIFDTTKLGTFLADILEGNPRRIKNFLNQLLMRARVYEKRHQSDLKAQGTNPHPKTPVDAKTVALLQAMRNYYPEIFSALEEDPQRRLTIIKGLQSNQPRRASKGLEAMVARLSFLPQLEELDLESQGDDDTENKGEALHAATVDDHYADARGLFLVLNRFKLAFIAHFTGFDDGLLKEYLRP